MRRFRLQGLMPLALIAVLFAACDSPRETARMKRAVRAHVQQGERQPAIALLNDLYDSHRSGEAAELGDDPADETAIRDKHGLLWRTERGLEAWIGGDPAGSLDHLRDAMLRVDAARQADVLGTAGSFVLNDTVRDYDGKGFEHHLVDYYIALNELLIGQKLHGHYLPRATRLSAPAPVVPPEAIAGPEPAVPDDLGANDRWDRAINAMRRLTIAASARTEYEDSDYRYRQSPFLCSLAAAVALAHPRPTADDAQFAEVMLERAEKLYREHQQAFGNDPAFRYEAVARPRFHEVLRARLQARDPASADAAAASHRLPPGHGSVLIVNHVGYVSMPETLDIRVIAHGGHRGGQGHRGHRFRIGSVWLYAEGPNAEALEFLTWLPLPGRLVGELSPGGLSYMGFAVPVHAHDHPIAPPARVAVDGRSHPLEVASDIDAYARATLKDEQPGVILKTFTRAALKQLAAIETTKAVQRSTDNALVGLITGIATSSAATLSEVADTRGVTLLPDHIETALIDLPAGSHQLELTVGGQFWSLGQVRVPEAGLVIVPVRSFPHPQPVPE